jgi:hypothetical protein
LNVVDAPDASFVVAYVNTQWFDGVAADDPLPERGERFAPEGAESFVQCAPLGTSAAPLQCASATTRS